VQNIYQTRPAPVGTRILPDPELSPILFPRLNAIHITQPVRESKILTHLCASSRFRTLEVNLGFREVIDSDVSSFLEDATRRSISIEHIDLRGSGSLRLYNAVSSITSLVSLRLRSGIKQQISPEVILALSLFPKLETFEIHAGPVDLESIEPISGKPMFPSLRHLRVWGCHALVPFILTHCQLNTLQTIEVRSPNSDDPVSYWQKVLAMIAIKASGSVAYVHLEDRGWSSSLSFPLELLQPLSLLQTLKIDLPSPLDFSDTEISRVFCSWPSLRELNFTALEGLDSVPQATLKGFRTLIKLCPHLERLSVHVDFSKPVEESSSSSLPAIKSDAMKVLFIGGKGDIPQPQALALLFHDMFPALSCLETVVDDTCENTWKAFKDEFYRLDAFTY
jgi:hypothetical protein